MHDWAPELRARLAGLRLAPAREAAIVEELSQHLDDRWQELVARGVAPETATRLTCAELEKADLLAPRLALLRQAQSAASPPPGVPGSRLFSGLWQDLRCALRTLRRQPLVALVAVVTLALGIGLNTAMFSFVNTLLLRPLPFPESGQLVRLFRTTPQSQYGGFSPGDFLSIKREETGFGRVAAYQPSTVMLPEPGWTTDWLRVSSDFFDVLGVPPARGRFFRPQEDVAGNDHVVVISHVLWQYRFGGAADIVGRTIRAGDVTYEIIGVLPDWAGDHRLFGQVGLFSPLTLGDDAAGAHAITMLGRRDRSLSPAQGAAFIASFGARMAADFPKENAKSGWRSEGLPESATSPTGKAILYMLLGLSAFVLLIACSNLANLLLARAIERTREFAVRTALGASRLQLTRTLVLEAFVLAAAGGAGAVMVAVWTTGWLRSLILTGGGPAFQFPMDWRVMTFASSVSALTVVCCGVVPALFTTRINTSETLKSGGRGATAGGRHRRVRHLLIVGQFGLSMTLLAGAGFFVRGAANLLTQPLGWSADRVVLGDINLAASSYPEGKHITRFHQRLVERLQQLPGVEFVSVSYGLPYRGLRGFARYIADGPDAQSGGSGLPAKLNGISPSYFAVTGTRLIAGRLFTDGDTAAAPRVAIISDAMARALFPDGNALGRRVAAAGPAPPAWMEIVGVVEGVRSIDVAQEPIDSQLYEPAAQDPRGGFMLAVRVAGVAPGSIVPSIRAAIAELDQNLDVRDLMPATTSMQQVTSQMRMVQQLLTAFAILGLLLAALGIYGAMTRMVVQRTEEIGVRMALGAPVRTVVGLVIGSGARIVLTGGVVGLLGAFGLSRLLASVLPAMQTNSLMVGAAVTAILIAIALFACYLPARRATQVDPMIALRSE